MNYRRAIHFGIVLAAILCGSKSDATDTKYSGPFVHDNLAIYLIHSLSQEGPVPLTLEEAFDRKSINVYETGRVSELEIENSGDTDVFIQSGDIVKGGRQDRALIVSQLLPPHSGRIAIAALCVERDRWSARDTESALSFSSSTEAVPSREAGLVMAREALALVQPAPRDTGEPRTASARIQPGLPDPTATLRPAPALSSQTKLWAQVDSIKRRLSEKVGADVASGQSRSSLQLALENRILRKRLDGYLDPLHSVGETPPDVVGFAVAINGKLQSANIYPSNALFRKMWPRLLRAAAIEALSEPATSAGKNPDIPALQAFLNDSAGGRAAETRLNRNVSLMSHVGAETVSVEARRDTGDWVHRSYLANH
jgi:hypothetical protein